QAFACSYSSSERALIARSRSRLALVSKYSLTTCQPGPCAISTTASLFGLLIPVIILVVNRQLTGINVNHVPVIPRELVLFSDMVPELELLPSHPTGMVKGNICCHAHCVKLHLKEPVMGLLFIRQGCDVIT